MEAPVQNVDGSSRLFRFGVFEFDPRLGELRKRGTAVKIQDKPLQILALLLKRPGDMVTRDELRQKLWQADTFVDFDHGVNTAINKLREALGDSAENPKYIQTVPRRGYRFIAPVQKTGRAPAVDAASATNKLMLAVLPLVNLTGNDEEEYFVDGMTEELIAQLAGLHPARLGVIARTSMMRYKTSMKSIEEIARELGVEYIVEGSVRRADGRVRITAQLIQASDQTHIWAQSYEREMSGILTLQSEVARIIAMRVQVQLTPAPAATIRPVAPKAYELYLKGRYYLNRANPQDHVKALAHFQQAAEEDPLYAPAYAGIADTFVFQAFYQGLPRELALKARNAAHRAIELDPDLADAHTSLAIIKALNDWDWAGADACFQRAIDLEPGSSDVHRVYSEFLSLMGRCEQALVEAGHARELDPLSSNANYDLAFALFMARQYDEAIEQVQKVLDLDPNCFPAHVGLAHIYALQSRYDEALAEFAQVGIGPELVAWIHALAGRNEPARKALSEALAAKEDPGMSPVKLSLVYFLLGEKEEAFRYMEQGYEQRDWLMICLRAFPPFDLMRSDSRFVDFCSRMGLPENTSGS
jgi:TolB-like protein/Flp pilus assembly protein TadD